MFRSSPDRYTFQEQPGPYTVSLYVFVADIEWDGITQRRRGPVKVVHSYEVYLASLLPEVYIYMIVRHPHICTDISVDAELVRDGYEISRRGRDKRVDHEYLGGRCLLSTPTSVC